MANSQDFKPCATCGKLYKPCPKCEEYRGAGMVFWRATCDTPECWQVHTTLHAYANKMIDKKSAAEELSFALTDDMKPYNENVRSLIEEILKKDEVEVRAAQDKEPRPQKQKHWNPLKTKR